MPALKSGPWSSAWKGFGLAIGHGGQGQVHRVMRNEAPFTPGVLKVMNSANGQDMHARQRMFRESLMLSRFGPGIGLPTLLDSNCKEHSNASIPLYLVMNFIEGISLNRYVLAQKNISIESAIEITVKLLSVVATLHELVPRVIHRDIKPANLLMSANEQPILLDFGLAFSELPGESGLEWETQEHLTGSDEKVGNGFLRLPEAEKNGNRDLRCDVTLCCAILLFLLTGEDAKSLEAAPHKRSEVVTHFNRFRQDDVNLLTRLLDKGFHVDIEQRYQDASELIAVLTEVLDQLKEVSPSRALKRSTLIPAGSELTVVGNSERLIRLEQTLVSNLRRLAHRAGMDDDVLAGMTYLQALEASKDVVGNDGNSFFERKTYEDIHGFVEKLDKPQPGDDQYFLVWYPAVNDYLNRKLDELDESDGELWMEMQRDRH